MSNELVRFKRVLRVREVEREVSQGELAVKLQEEEDLLERMDLMTTKRDDALSAFCSDKTRVISPQELWFERQNLEIMEKKIDAGRQELADCRVAIEEKKSELLEKHKNVQLMEGFCEKLLERENKKMRKTEQDRLDDIAAIRYLRNLCGGAGV